MLLCWETGASWNWSTRLSPQGWQSCLGCRTVLLTVCAECPGPRAGGSVRPAVDWAAALLHPAPAAPCSVLRVEADRTPSVPGPCEPEDLIDGIIFAANYLGSTQLLSERNPSKNIRMMQAQEAVSRVKVGARRGRLGPTAQSLGQEGPGLRPQGGLLGNEELPRPRPPGSRTRERMLAGVRGVRVFRGVRVPAPQPGPLHRSGRCPRKGRQTRFTSLRDPQETGAYLQLQAWVGAPGLGVGYGCCSPVGWRMNCVSPSPVLPVDATSCKGAEGMWRPSPPEGSTEPPAARLLCPVLCPVLSPALAPADPGVGRGLRHWRGCRGLCACLPAEGLAVYLCRGLRSGPWGVDHGTKPAPAHCLCFLLHAVQRMQKAAKIKKKAVCGTVGCTCVSVACPCRGLGGGGFPLEARVLWPRAFPPPLQVNSRLWSETTLFFKPSTDRRMQSQPLCLFHLSFGAPCAGMC